LPHQRFYSDATVRGSQEWSVLGLRGQENKLPIADCRMTMAIPAWHLRRQSAIGNR
jgi:hypothetical protein